MPVYKSFEEQKTCLNTYELAKHISEVSGIKVSDTVFIAKDIIRNIRSANTNLFDSMQGFNCL